MDISREKRDGAIDMLITLVVEELSQDLGIDADEMLPAFLNSKTGALLYDGDSGLWRSGPSDIAEMYKKEKQ